MIDFQSPANAFVPQGHLKIARHVSAGSPHPLPQVPKGRLNFCPLIPFLSFHQDYPTKPNQGNLRHLSGLGSCEKNLAEPKVAQRPSERARASQFKPNQGVLQKKKIVYFFRTTSTTSAVSPYTSHSSYSTHLLMLKICSSIPKFTPNFDNLFAPIVTYLNQF